MKRLTHIYQQVLRAINVALLLLTHAVTTWAQEFDDFDEPDRMNDRQQMGQEGFEGEEDMMPGFNLSRYTDEIIDIVLLVIIIAVVRRIVRKQHRTGCTFFIIAFAILWYFVDRYVYW